MTDSPSDPRPGTGTVRFGIIGVGAAGSEIQAITRHPHLTIAAAADHDPAALDRFRERFPSAACYLSVEELCASADVDAVFVGTPTENNKGDGGINVTLRPLYYPIAQAAVMITLVCNVQHY